MAQAIISIVSRGCQSQKVESFCFLGGGFARHRGDFDHGKASAEPVES